jgi:hypothetical protein
MLIIQKMTTYSYGGYPHIQTHPKGLLEFSYEMPAGAVQYGAYLCFSMASGGL